jgi:hypothetical protein
VRVCVWPTDCNHFGKFGGLADVINSAKYQNDGSKGFRSAGT